MHVQCVCVYAQMNEWLQTTIYTQTLKKLSSLRDIIIIIIIIIIVALVSYYRLLTSEGNFRTQKLESL